MVIFINCIVSILNIFRFYNNSSSFVHGGLESNRESIPAIGQKQIHQKIQALNFQDCHAKINQVDSQPTLGNGVVVQVLFGFVYSYLTRLIYNRKNSLYPA